MTTQSTQSLAQDLFENAVHIGHRTQKWNPRMKKFIYGEKDGFHVINLEQTIAHLESALEFVSKLSSEGKTILFVSTKPQSLGVVEEAAKKCGMPYVISKWIPGLITNYSTVKLRIKYLADLKEQEANGEFEKYTKKEASKLKKTIDKLQIALGGVKDLKDLPDAVFVIDVVRDNIVVAEARKKGIPIVALLDTNADPSLVDYPIPANDDALKSLEYFISKITEAVQSRKAKK